MPTVYFKNCNKTDERLNQDGLTPEKSTTLYHTNRVETDEPPRNLQISKTHGILLVEKFNHRL